MSVKLYHTVLRGEPDAAIIVQPRFALPETCSWVTLRSEPLVALAPPGMAGRNPHILLGQEPIIRYDHNNWSGQVVDQYLRRDSAARASGALGDRCDRSAGSQRTWCVFGSQRLSPWPVELSVAKRSLPDQTTVLCRSRRTRSSISSVRPLERASFARSFERSTTTSSMRDSFRRHHAPPQDADQMTLTNLPCPLHTQRRHKPRANRLPEGESYVAKISFT